MATYAIGDIQGCYFSFQRLLDHIGFDLRRDRLWLVGDLVNRGPGSLEVLRWMVAHQDSIVAVLGNHDLHTLAVAEGYVSFHKGDTLQALLAAPDREELLHWLRHQHMAYVQNDFLMVHAGLLPQWTCEQAVALGAEVEDALRSKDYRLFFAKMYGNFPDCWDDHLEGVNRLRMITNAMTRLRVCTNEGRMDFRFKGELKDVPVGFMPWFDVPSRKSIDKTIVFGHWSALGLQQRGNLAALDTGCLWGGQLTTMRLEDRAVFQVPCSPQDLPRHFLQTEPDSD